MIRVIITQNETSYFSKIIRFIAKEQINFYNIIGITVLGYTRKNNLFKY